MHSEFFREIVEFHGARVLICYHYDYDSGPPWDREDGHGPVRRSDYRHGPYGSDKGPGERPLNDPDRNCYQYYYDWQGAMEIAKREGWNAEPYDAPDKVRRAVQADFDYLRGWLHDDWHYAGVVCTIVDNEGDPVKVDGERFEESVWGFETLKDYHLTAGRELADELVQTYLAEVDTVEEQAW